MAIKKPTKSTKKNAPVEPTVTPTVTAEQAAQEDAELKKKAAAEKARKTRAAIADAKKAIVDYIKTLEDVPQEITNACALVCKPKAQRAKGDSWLQRLKTWFPEIGSELNEFDIFKETKMGVREFGKKCTDLASRTRKTLAVNPTASDVDNDLLVVMTFTYDETSGNWRRDS